MNRIPLFDLVEIIKNPSEYSKEDLIEKYDITYGQVHYLEKKYDIRFQSDFSKECTERNEMIAKLYPKMSYAAIGKLFNISKQRVNQIIKNYNQKENKNK